MKIVIQCAGRKKETAETFTLNGAEQIFVARPAGLNQVRPWDTIPATVGKTWIDCARAYGNAAEWVLFQNAGVGISGGGNLTEAGELYLPQAYSALVSKFGKENVYILSAGWGLVRADAGIPTYDVTFCTAKNVPENAKVNPQTRSAYHSILDAIDGDDEVHLFITGTYHQYWTIYFANMIMNTRKFFYHLKKGAGNAPANIRVRDIISHEVAANTNWHYKAVIQIIELLDEAGPLQFSTMQIRAEGGDTDVQPWLNAMNQHKMKFGP